MSLPQLRIRTEYSFRSCYGPLPHVQRRLQELGCGVAGIVDANGTWGHVAWEKTLTKAGIEPLFGTELTFKLPDGRSPKVWVLAEDLAAFYRLSSAPPEAPEGMAGVKGVVRFAGAALTNPDHFDYIDINPRSRLRTQAALRLAAETGKPLVLTSDNDYPAEEDRMRFLAWDDSKKMTPQHILSEAELRKALWYVPGYHFDVAASNTYELGQRLAGLRLQKAPIIQVPGDLHAMVEEGRRMRLERGHIAAWDERYAARLQRELDMIREKQFESYFIVVSDMVRWAKQHMLVGPARGSSAGSLVCYLLQITEVDPLIHDLIFERFIDVNRSDLPDIDIDFNDQKREMVFEYARKKYGVENVARIGSVNRLKPRSIFAHVGKKLGIPPGATFSVANVLIEHSSGDSRYGKALEDTLTGTQPGRDFIARYPEAKIMMDLEEHASHSGQHAAGVIISNVPVIEYCTVRDGIAQIDKKDAEYLNLLKIDALGLRTLGVIEECGCITSQQLYDLKLDDPEVFRVFNEHKFSGIFQFEGAAQRRVSVQVPIEAFRQIDHVTALARPGPLGGGATVAYVNRNLGREEVTFRHPSMSEYLGDTLGVVLYQEQVMRISFEIGRLPWPVVSEIRRAMSGSKGKEYFDRRGAEFIEGALTLGLTEPEARAIWDEICSFGSWGMNKSHTVSYAIISYWCAYMKRYHPLEYAAACLRNAKDDDQTIEILRELNKEGVGFVSFDPEKSRESWAVVDGRLIGGFDNLHGIGPVKAAYYVQKRDSVGLDKKDLAAIEKAKVKHNDLRPIHSAWGAVYDDPDSFNIRGRVREFADLEDGENAVVVCKLVRTDRRDENEALLVGKRGYAKEGQTLFLDAHVVDDSISKPIVARVRPRLWKQIGEVWADRSAPGDFFLLRGRWLGEFSMLIVEKVRCLNKPEMFL